MSNSKIDKISEIIPQFYFDLIARVAPGAVILLLYGIDFYLNNEIKFPDLGRTLIFFICLLCSYFIGLVLDITLGILILSMFFLMYKLSSGIFKRKDKIIEKLSINMFEFWNRFIAKLLSRKFEIWNDNEIWKKINGLKNISRASVLTKIVAEKTLFRTMLFVSLFTFVIPPGWILTGKYLCSFSVKMLITAIFFACFIRFEICVRVRHDVA